VNFAELESHLKARKIPIAICKPENSETVTAAMEASDQGYVECAFVGNGSVMQALLNRIAPGFKPRIIHASTEEEAAAKAVGLVRDGTAEAIVKGTLSTPVFLKAILNSELGIKKGKVLSHVLVYEWEGSFKFLTDGGMIPHPTLEEKFEIIKNAVEFARRLGCEKPRVAVLSAVETVSFKMQSSIDAAVLAKMGERGQITGCTIDGPLALDNAISLESAHHKGLSNEVVGKADILIAPDIDTGNILGKTILYFGKIPAGGVILGAAVPVVMLSRSDNKQTRLNSLKLAFAGGPG